MATNIYKLHVAYEGLEDKIWRDVEVSENYRLARLGYTILATFDTMAYHLFEFRIAGERFQIPHEEFDADKDLDMARFSLRQLCLQIGDAFAMDYDFGTTQTFIVTVTHIRPLEKGSGRAYPKIVAGEGSGIIDDMSVDGSSELISQIESTGKTIEEIYYQDRSFPWNFRLYDIKCDNALLKGQIQLIEEGYWPLWDQ